MCERRGVPRRSIGEFSAFANALIAQTSLTRKIIKSYREHCLGLFSPAAAMFGKKKQGRPRRKAGLLSTLFHGSHWRRREGARREIHERRGGGGDNTAAVEEPPRPYPGCLNELTGDDGDGKNGKGGGDSHGKKWGLSAHSKGKGEGSAPSIAVADLPKYAYFCIFSRLVRLWHRA